MLLNKVFNPNVVTILPAATVEDAATCMADRRIGALVVVEDNKPVGIVTDRDLAVRALIKRRPLGQLYVRDVMTPKPVCASERTTLEEALEQMRFYRIRRLIVVNDAQKVVGIVSLDDIFALLDEEQRALRTVTEVLRAVHHEAGESAPAPGRP